MNNEGAKRIKPIKMPLMTSTNIMSFLTLIRSIILPDQKLVTSIAIGLMTNRPASAVADPVRFKTIMLIATK
ncbi:hypothetical protein YDYSG_40480 [Paenibacillus tyrfis]|nr:hypothetical protein YDYSG_40480 [Paenibacillus tyrfis]GMX65675.1 hypothetical protein Elgi_49460 [Paenibacillus elgii]